MRGRQEGGGRNQGSPLLTPARWNLYIVLLFGFFPGDTYLLQTHNYFTKRDSFIPIPKYKYVLSLYIRFSHLSIFSFFFAPGRLTLMCVGLTRKSVG